VTKKKVFNVGYRSAAQPTGTSIRRRETRRDRRSELKWRRKKKMMKVK
jgi:hypothetical protein